MNNYHISSQAQEDLHDIWLYIARDSFEAADRILDAINDGFISLGDMPGIGHVREDLTDKDVRFFSVHKYMIVFRLLKSGVEIVRVLHGYRDIQRIL